MIADSPYPLVIVLLNNNGGKIFSYLPIAKQNRIYKKYFETPQNMTFEHIAKQYELNHIFITSNSQFQSEYMKVQKY